MGKPLDATFSLVPAAMKVGLRSDIGLALQMLPPTLCKSLKGTFTDINVQLCNNHVTYINATHPYPYYQRGLLYSYSRTDIMLELPI